MLHLRQRICAQRSTANIIIVCAISAAGRPHLMHSLRSGTQMVDMQIRN
jgi:hypothetical protein